MTSSTSKRKNDNKTSLRRPLILVAVVICLLVGVGIALFLLNSSSSTSTDLPTARLLYTSNGLRYSLSLQTRVRVPVEMPRWVASPQIGIDTQPSYYASQEQTVSIAPDQTY